MTRPSVYVVVQGQFGQFGGLGGCLLLDTGEVLWDHISSDLTWLTHDLTSGFSDRRIELEHRYPDGYEVVVAVQKGDVPDDVLARNAEWLASEEGSS